MSAHFSKSASNFRYYKRHEHPKKIEQLVEYYKYHEDVPRIYMEPMSSTVHMYYDFKRRLTYIEVTKMLARKKEEERRQNLGETVTHVKEKRDMHSSDEHEKTHKNNSNEKSKHVVMVEEDQDLLDFDFDGDLEDFNLNRKKRVYVDKSLKKVLPESLIYSLMNWKKPEKQSQVNVTRPKINSNRKYIDFDQDSRFFLRDFFANDWGSQSEILNSARHRRGSNLKTLPYEYAQRVDDTKSETLMDLNAILSSQKGALPINEDSFRCVESFMIESHENKQVLQLDEKEIERMKAQMKRKKQVQWEEIVEASKKDFRAEESFYKHLKLKDIEKLMKRTQTRESNRRLGEALMDKIKNKRIYDQLKSYSNKILKDKNLFTKKFKMAKKKSSICSPKQLRTGTLKTIKLGGTKDVAEKDKWKLKKSTVDHKSGKRGGRTPTKKNQSVSKRASRKRAKSKRTNSEAIDKLILQSQLKSKARPGKVTISEVLTDVKKKTRFHTNSGMRRKKSKKRLLPGEFEMLMTAGSNKLAPRRDQLRPSKQDINRLIRRKRTGEPQLVREKLGKEVPFEIKKKSLRLAEEMRGIYESLAESGLASVDVRFKSTKKKLTRGDLEFNLKRLSNADKKQFKGVKSPDKRKKKGGFQRQLNVKLRKKSKDNDLRIRKTISSMRRMELEVANEVSGRKKLKLSSNMLKSAKMDTKFGLKDHLNFFDRKSINCRSQKGLNHQRDLFGERVAQAKSKDKAYRRRQSEKNILIRKENALANGSKHIHAGKSIGVLRKKSKPRRDIDLGKAANILAERDPSKSKKARRKKKKEEKMVEFPKKEMWGLGKKKRMLMSKDTESDKRAKQKTKRGRLDQEIFQKLGNPKLQSLLVCQRKDPTRIAMLMDSLTEKTMNSGLHRKSSKKLLGKLNFDILSKKKPRKKDLKSLSKIFKKGLLRSKNEDRMMLFEHKSKSMKKKREMTMQ